MNLDQNSQLDLFASHQMAKFLFGFLVRQDHMDHVSYSNNSCLFHRSKKIKMNKKLVSTANVFAIHTIQILVAKKISPRKLLNRTRVPLQVTGFACLGPKSLGWTFTSEKNPNQS